MKMWLIDNLAIKIGALLIALFLWFHAVTEQEYEVRRQVPLEVTDVPGDLILAQPLPAEGNIRLRGKGKRLIVPYFSDIRLQVPAAEAEKGSLAVSLSHENVYIPHGSGAAMAEIVSPLKLTLEFDTLVQKRVPIQSRITLTPLEGFVQVGSITFLPDSVLVHGPSRYVDAITSVLTDSVSYSGAKKPVMDLISLMDPDGFNVTCIPRQIEANGNVQRLIERTITGVPVTLTNIPKGVTAHLEPGDISITVSGGEEYLASLTKESFSAFADYSRAHERSGYRINARINLPPQVELIGADPQTFRVVQGS
jgi:YbbR domain-containing protein